MLCVPTPEELLGWKNQARRKRSTLLNAGGDGRVVAILGGSGQHVAVKYIAAKNDRAQRSELYVIRRLENTHPHIVHTYGMVRSSSGSVYIMQERAVCDLHDAAGACEGRAMGEGANVREWMLQVAHALRACHDINIAHRDVKPENILLNALPALTATGTGAAQPPAGSTQEQLGGARTTPPRDAQQSSIISDQRGILFSAIGAFAGKGAAGNVRAAPRSPLCGASNSQLAPHLLAEAKLCDFGAAFCGHSDASSAVQHVAKRACGSKHYCAPEVTRLIITAKDASGWRLDDAPLAAPPQHSSYNPFPTDVWSFGMTLFALTSGLQPFRRAHVSDAMFRAFVWATQREAARHPLCEPTHPGWAQTARNRHTWRWPRSMSRELVDVLGRCLVVDPGQRASMAEVCGHAFFTADSPCDDASPSAQHLLPSPSLSAVSQIHWGAGGVGVAGCDSGAPTAPAEQQDCSTADDELHACGAKGSSLTWEGMARSPGACPGSPVRGAAHLGSSGGEHPVGSRGMSTLNDVLAEASSVEGQHHPGTETAPRWASAGPVQEVPLLHSASAVVRLGGSP